MIIPQKNERVDSEAQAIKRCNMKKIILLLALVIVITGFIGCNNTYTSSQNTLTNETTEENNMNYPFEILAKDTKVNATIKIKDKGEIKLELYPDVAPVSVSNFVYLSEKGFYDGLIFHRVINGFMIQGGDPEGIGIGGPGYSIEGEFAANGVKNDISHERGVLSMARSQNYNSAGSQFFIMHADGTYLDGQYAAFGRVTEGIEVVDMVASTQTDSQDRPVEDVVIESITIER